MANSLEIISLEGKSLINTSEKFTAGRTESNKLQILDDSISRVHAEFVSFGNEWFVKDNGSTNGTSLNGVAIVPNHYTALRTNDKISLGSYHAYVNVELGNASGVNICLFKGSQYQGTFIVTEDQSFYYGGSKSVIQDNADDLNDLKFLIKYSSGKTSFSIRKIDPNIKINGINVESDTTLNDRDIVSVNNYNMLINIYEKLDGSQQDTNNSDEVELPDYIKARIGEDNWNDPLEQKRKNLTGKLTLDNLQHDDSRTEKIITKNATSELGISRFSKPSLEILKFEEQEKDKKYALYGIITLVILLGMFSVIFNVLFKIIIRS